MARRDLRLTGAARVALLCACAALPLAFLAIFFVLPVGGMVARGLHPGGHWSWVAFGEVLGRRRTQRVIWFTLWMSLVATVLTVLLGLAVAYVTYRLRWRGAGLVRGLVVMPFVLPSVVVGVAFRTLLAPTGPLGFLGWDGGWQAILAAMVFFNVSVVVRMVGPAWAGLDPRTEEAAAALGASPWTVRRTVTLPALLPPVLSAASVVFFFCASAFGVVLVLGGTKYSTIESEIYLLTTSFLDLRGAAVLSLLQVAVVVSLLAATEQVRKRVPAPSRRIGRGALQPVSRSAALPLAATAAVVALVVVPLATLVWRSLQTSQGLGLDNYRRLGVVSADTYLQTTVWSALNLSLRIAVDATIVAVVLGAAVTYVVTRRPRRATGRAALAFLDGAFLLPLGVSAVTVGFGFLITLDRPPLDLRTSSLLVVFAQAMVALPLVIRTIAPAVRSLDPRQKEAAAALGASPFAVARTVVIPALIRPALAAVGLAFAVSLGEFGATSFLARPQQPTLPVIIYQLLGHPGSVYFGMALAGSVILAIVTSVIMAVVDRLRVVSAGTI